MWVLVLALLALTPSVPAQEPQLQNYSIGVAISLEPDSHSGKWLVKLTADGSVELRNGRDERAKIAPRASFLLNTDGTFERSELTLDEHLQYGLVKVDARPRVILGENGQPWMILPSSLLPKVNGASIAALPGAQQDVKKMLAMMMIPAAPEKTPEGFSFQSQAPAKPPALPPLKIGKPPCPPALLQPVPQPIDQAWIDDVQKLKLRDPTARWTAPDDGADAYRKAWRRFMSVDSPPKQ